MSTLEISDYSYSSSYDDDDDYYDPRDIWEENRNALRRECRSSLDSVLSGCVGLSEEFRRDVAVELRQLEALTADIVQQYTYEEFSLADRIGDHRTALNQRVMDVRQKVAALRIEQEETARQVGSCLANSREIFSGAFSTQVLATYEAEVKKIKEEIRQAEQLPSLRQKSRRLEGLLDKLHKLADLHGFAKTVDLSGIEEEKVKVPAAVGKKKALLAALRRDIEQFSVLIRELDEEAWQRLQQLVADATDCDYEQRLRAARDQVKLTYGNVKEKAKATHAYREALWELRGRLSGSENSETLAEEIDRACRQKYLGPQEFSTLSAKVNAAIRQAEEDRRLKQRKQAFVAKVRENLIKLNYAVVYEHDRGEDAVQKLERGETVYFDTRWAGYKIMTKLNERGELVTRMVKAVASEVEQRARTDYQRQQDLEIARSWCGDYDRFMEGMLRDGVRINVRVRRQPEEEEILYVVNKELAEAGEKLGAAKPGKQTAMHLKR